MRLNRSPPDPRRAVVAGFLAMLALSACFAVTDWDRSAAAAWWSYGHGSWAGREELWAWLPYRLGVWPAYVVGVLGALAFFAGYASPRALRWRGPGLYLALLLLLGPGLLVNIFAKGLSGRPRPSEIIDFGGTWPFRRPWQLGTPGQGGSFISGHASMAFYWFALVHLAKTRGQRVLAFAGTLAFGLWMGAARMAQGGHFLSDILLCGALMWTLAAALSPLIHWQPAPAFWARPKVLAALGIAIAGVLVLGHPVYEERELLWARPERQAAVLATQRLTAWQASKTLEGVDLNVELDRGDLAVDFQATDDGQCWPLRVAEVAQGLGLPGARVKLDQALAPAPSSTLSASVRQHRAGAWWRFHGLYRASLPAALALDVHLKTAEGVLTIASLPLGRQILVNGSLQAQDLPAGFHPFGERSWVRDGAQPQIALDLSATSVRFLP